MAEDSETKRTFDTMINKEKSSTKRMVSDSDLLIRLKTFVMSTRVFRLLKKVAKLCSIRLLLLSIERGCDDIAWLLIYDI